MLIETNRLILREFQPTDLQELTPILVPKFMRFSPTDFTPFEQVQERIEDFITSYKEFGFGQWAVVLKENNQLLGYCGISMDWIDGKSEKTLQYQIDSRYWGQGLATEAASAAIKAGFELFNLPYIFAIVERANLASVRVLEKVGMQYEGALTSCEMDVYRINAAYEMSTRKTWYRQLSLPL